MDVQMRPKVQVSAEDTSKSYYKYYEMPPKPIAPEKMGMVFGRMLNPTQAVAFADRKNIQNGSAPAEVGYGIMPDGTGYACDVTFIPGATEEMVLWYFAWRGLDPLRFVISNPIENIAAMTMQSRKTKDTDLSYSERLWDSTQEVTRLTPMGPATMFLNFKCPSAVGFDLDADATSSNLLCARGYNKGEPPMAGPDFFVCYDIKEKDGGVEVTTRIWIGWTVLYGKDYKQLPDGFYMPLQTPMQTLMPFMAEMEGLSAILPALYAEEKDNF